MSTISVTNVKHESSASNNISLDSSGRVLVGTSTAGAFSNRRVSIATSSGTTALELRSATDGDSRIVFTDSTDSGDAGSYKGQILYDQSSDFMSFNTNGNNERMRLDSSGNLQFNSGYGSVATAYGCRAWIIFNGTSASIGTGYGSANVTSVTDAGTGRYVVNFTNAMPDTNFSTLATCRHNEGTAPGFVSFARNDGYQRSTGATDELRVHTTSGTYDSDPVCVAVFR